MSEYKDCADLAEKCEKKVEVEKLKAEKQSIGFFKFKEKQAVQVKIDACESRIKEIDTELTKPR